jgi:hypothetical protein
LAPGRLFRDLGERVAALEVQVKSIVGNGQPGRLTLVENSVSTLQRWKYWLMGVAASVSAIMHYVLPTGKH